MAALKEWFRERGFEQQDSELIQTATNRDWWHSVIHNTLGYGCERKGAVLESCHKRFDRWFIMDVSIDFKHNQFGKCNVYTLLLFPPKVIEGSLIEWSQAISQQSRGLFH